MHPADAPQSHPPFFIVGNDRSGTTMLRVILDRSDEVAIPTESMFLGDFVPYRRGRVDLSRHEDAVDFARLVWNHPKVRLWGLECDAPVPPIDLTHDEAYRYAVEAPYKAFAARDGKSRWADKTPPYLYQIDELLTVWPDARIIVLVRDGRDVALSIMPLPFGGNNVYSTARDWGHGIRVGLRAMEDWPSNVMMVRYEDLCARPEEQVRDLCAFLDIPFSDAMLRVEDTPADKIVADQAGWFGNLWQGINRKSVGKWRTRMTPRQQALFASVAGAELVGLGYDLGPHAGRPALMGPRAFAYRVHDFSARLYNFVRLRLLQERGRELQYVMRRKLQRL